MPLSRLIPRPQIKSRVVVAVALLLLVALAVFGLISRRSQPAVRDINYTQLRELAETGTARSVNISGEDVVVSQTDGTLTHAIVTNAVAQHEVAAAFEKGHVPVEVETMQPGGLATALEYVLPCIAIPLFGVLSGRGYAGLVS